MVAVRGLYSDYRALDPAFKAGSRIDVEICQFVFRWYGDAPYSAMVRGVDDKREVVRSVSNVLKQPDLHRCEILRTIHVWDAGRYYRFRRIAYRSQRIAKVVEGPLTIR